MPSLAAAALDAAERRVLTRFVERLRHECGSDLHAVWLYGSRARGERTGPESDIDILVVSTPGDLADQRRATDLVDATASEEGLNPAWFAVTVVSPEHISARRKIESFFVREVDRDKIVLHGSP